MQTPIRIFVAAACLFSACSTKNAQSKKGYTLTGDLKNSKHSFIYLQKFAGSETITDSVPVVDGKFVFKGKVAAPEYVSLTNENKRGARGISFFLENSSISLSADADSLYAGTLTGSTSQLHFKEWGQTWQSITSVAGGLYQKLERADKHPNKDSAAIIRAEGQKGFDDLDKRLQAAVGAFVDKYPNSAVSAFVINDRFITYPYPELAKKEFAKLGPDAKNSSYGIEISASLESEAKTAVGVTPEMTLPDANGKMISLADFRGKVVLVDFWASWCGPCRKENPNLVNAYKAFHDKGFDIIGVSLDHVKESWEKAIDADGLTWTHVSDLKAWKGKYVEEFGIKSVPTSFIVDREGKVVAKNLRGEELEKTLAELFR